MKKKSQSSQKSQINDTKLKPLKPTLRLKKRFIKIKIISKNKNSFEEISNDLTKQIIFYIGSLEFGKAGIWFLKDKFDFENQELTLKVSTKQKEKLIAILSLINKINNKESKIEIIKVSGTLKGLNNITK